MAAFEVTAANLKGKNVLFNHNGPLFLSKKETLFRGSVIDADDERQIAGICYLEGAKSYTDKIPYSKLVAIADTNAEHLTIGIYSGPYIDLRQ